MGLELSKMLMSRTAIVTGPTSGIAEVLAGADADVMLNECGEPVGIKQSHRGRAGRHGTRAAHPGVDLVPD